VVISVDNSDGRLLPYLTVRLLFEVEARKNILTVPNAALRWQPEIQYVVPEARDSLALALQSGRPAKAKSVMPNLSSENEAAGVLWVRQGEFVRPANVKLGLSDGVFTEISGSGLVEGMEIVVSASRMQSDPDALSILPHTWSDSKK
jgi:HlyD family secretion protein